MVEVHAAELAAHPPALLAHLVLAGEGLRDHPGGRADMAGKVALGDALGVHRVLQHGDQPGLQFTVHQITILC